MKQKTLNNKIANCQTLQQKHEWSLIDYDTYFEVFECLKCNCIKKVNNYTKEMDILRK